MPSSDVPVNVRGWVVLLMAIRTRVSRDLATLVPDQVPHPSESRVALWTDVTRDTGLRPHVWPFQYPYIWKESGQLVLRRSIRYCFFFVLLFFLSLSKTIYIRNIYRLGQVLRTNLYAFPHIDGRHFPHSNIYPWSQIVSIIKLNVFSTFWNSDTIILIILIIIFIIITICKIF